MIHKPNFFVFTGGPGVGKTTLIRHLQAKGERVVDETARAVIREQIETNGTGLPWIDNDRFADLTAARDIANFDGLLGETCRVFFDRGIVDSYGANAAIPSPLIINAVRTRRYNPKVFVFPPWREIYAVDAERRQDWAEAEATFERVLNNLTDLEYKPVIVPKGETSERAAFILDTAR